MKRTIPDNSGFNIRPLLINDLPRALELSDCEGWNQTEKDWRLLIDNPLNICLAAVYDNTIIGTATALNHFNDVAWIGMVLVDKQFRGQGVGKMLLTSIIDKLRTIDSVKLDATQAGLPLYKKLGFIDEYMIYRMINPSFQSLRKYSFSYVPANICQESFPDVQELDKMAFGADRTYLLQNLLRNYPGKAYMLKINNKIDGYIFGRDGIRYNYVGPVIAYSIKSAMCLISKALQSLENKPVALDVLYDKKELINWLESLGFEKQRHFIRMYFKSNSCAGKTNYQYLISGPEFG